MGNLKGIYKRLATCLAVMATVPSFGAEVVQYSPVVGSTHINLDLELTNNDPSAIYNSAELSVSDMLLSVAQDIQARSSDHSTNTIEEIIGGWDVHIWAPPTGEISAGWTAILTNGIAELEHAPFGYTSWISTSDNPDQDMMALTVQIPKSQLDFNGNGTFDAQTEAIVLTTNEVSEVFEGIEDAWNSHHASAKTYAIVDATVINGVYYNDNGRSDVVWTDDGSYGMQIDNKVDENGTVRIREIAKVSDSNFTRDSFRLNTAYTFSPLVDGFIELGSAINEAQVTSWLNFNLSNDGNLGQSQGWLMVDNGDGTHNINHIDGREGRDYLVPSEGDTAVRDTYIHVSNIPHAHTSPTGALLNYFDEPYLQIGFHDDNTWNLRSSDGTVTYSTTGLNAKALCVSIAIPSMLDLNHITRTNSNAYVSDAGNGIQFTQYDPTESQTHRYLNFRIENNGTGAFDYTEIHELFGDVFEQITSQAGIELDDENRSLNIAQTGVNVGTVTSGGYQYGSYLDTSNDVALFDCPDGMDPAFPDSTIDNGEYLEGSIAIRKDLDQDGLEDISAITFNTNKVFQNAVVGDAGDGLNYWETHVLAYSVTIPRTTSGTPHWWLRAHGTTNDYEMIDATDPDNDSFQTWQEYIAGTNPTNGASYFMQTLSHTNEQPVVSWVYASNRLYTVSMSTNLMNGFQTLTNGLTDSSFIDTLTTTTNAVFYRVSVELEP